MTSDENVRVALLLDGEYINKYAANAIVKMISETSAEVSLLVINDSNGGDSGDRDILTEILGKFRILYNLIQDHGVWASMIIKRSLFPPEFSEKVHIDDISCLEETPRITTQPIPANGLGNKLTSSVVGEISDSSDIVIRFGFGILKGDILTQPEYGVVSYHHGDIRKYRGRAGGFWAFINNDDEAGVTLQKLNESLDGGGIIEYRSVDTSDIYTYKEVRYRIHNISEEMLASCIRQIENGTYNPTSPEELGDLYTDRGISSIFKFLYINTKGYVKKILKQIWNSNR